MVGAFQFRIRDFVLVFALLAVFCAWWADRSKINQELDFYIAIHGVNTEERVIAIESRSWSRAPNDLRSLVFLLADPYPAVQDAAEAELERLFPAVLLEGNETKTGSFSVLERLGFWSSFVAGNPSNDASATGETDHERSSHVEDPFDF